MADTNTAATAADAARFLKLLDPTVTKFEFRTFDDDKDREDDNLTRTFYGTLAQHAAELQRFNHKGAGVFVTINETDGISRKAENIVRVRAVFVDLDGAPLAPVMAAKLKPHIVNETSPGRWHCSRSRSGSSPPAAGPRAGCPGGVSSPGCAGLSESVRHSSSTPVIGPLFAHTVTLPLGLLLAEPGARGVFLPQTMPDGFVKNTATPLLLRPREFIANARDLVTLKAAVAEQAPRYAEIKAPVTIITGDADKTVSTNIHSRPFAAAAPNAKLIVLPGVGHMIQQAAPDLVTAEVEAMISGMAPGAAAAAH